MREQFKKYSKYYDALYQKKDYEGEVAFVKKIFTKYSGVPVKNILSLGCGTANHETLLAAQGYTITGVDISDRMLALARNKTDQLSLTIDFQKGDVRKYRTNKKFDAVISLFNIAGYQNTNNDFEKYLLTASRHLKKGGLFIFDAWYQPAVLKDRPKNRKRTIALDKGHTITRETSQTIDIQSGILYILFRITETRNNKVICKISEEHPMRFFTLRELEYFFSKTGFVLLNACQPLRIQVPVSENSWNMYVIAKRL